MALRTPTLAHTCATLLTGTAAEQPYDSVVSRTAISSHSGIQRLRDTSGGLIDTTMLSYTSTIVSGLLHARARAISLLPI